MWKRGTKYSPDPLPQSMYFKEPLSQNRFADALRVLNDYRERLPRWVQICTKDGIPMELRTEQCRADAMIEHIKRLQQQGAEKK